MKVIDLFITNGIFGPKETAKKEKEHGYRKRNLNNATNCIT